MKKIFILSALITGLGTFSFCHAPAAMADTVEHDKPPQGDLALHKHYVSINFDKDDAAVDDTDRKDLKALVKSLQENPGQLKVIIAAWSDKDYPTKRSEAQTPYDIDLAKKRASHIKAYLKKYGPFGEVETYNMAQQVTAFDEVFHKDETQTKKSYAGKSAFNEADMVAHLLKNKGKESRAEVIIYDPQKLMKE